jgi:hypothetical protein
MHRPQQIFAAGVLGPMEDAMADDRTNRGPQDRSRISLSEDYEVRYWTKELGVSKDELARLVQRHGSSVDKIRAELAK